jgi:poly-gamma-glutamate synthesis protein (capsule biosynthesis protein)
VSGKKEYFIILLFSIGIPLCTYPIASYYFSKNNTDEISPLPIIQKEKKTKSEPVSLLFVGDIMLDRTIRKDGELYGYSNLFSCLEEEFSKYDGVIGNLEGTISTFESVSRDAPYEAPESFRFTFDPNAVRALYTIGLSIVSLANNHIRDFGNEGISQTIEHSSKMGLKTFGDPRVNMQRYHIKTFKNTRIAFIPYNQFFGTAEQTYADLKTTESLSDVQIIFAHWGDEYVSARMAIKNLAHSFVDAGADLVIGAHPHIIQEKEIYKNVPVYYSLGNFIFDQYWEESVKTGLAVAISMEDKNISIQKELETESIRHKGTCFKKPLTR